MLSALRDALEERNVPTDPLTELHVSLTDLPMQLHVHDVTAHDAFKGKHSVSATFDVRSPGATTNGVCVLATGVGDTPDLTARDAVDQWLTGVFPPIVSWLTQESHVSAVTKAEMIVAIEDSNDRFGWSVHLGPILPRLYSRPGADYSIPDVPEDTVFKRIFQAVHPYAAHSDVFWLECFAARYPEGRVDATARLRNHAWPEGEEALECWASEWPDTDGCILSRRQFLLFEPLPPEDLGPSLHASFDQFTHKKPPWWRRFIGGAWRGKLR